ncbi:MAG: FAD-binding oxidoreductase [Anaerolineae bacterium]|nr:FAD-binding oxidoreductase [Anaerolineae bacterium]
MSTLPSSAQVVIIGGGVMGASTAYHLALRGMRDVVLLESQSFFGQGATGKCAGGIRYQFSTAINIRLSQISLPMLNRFEDETGQFIDLRYPGYMLLATTEENIAEFKRNIELQHSLGVPTEWLSQDEVRRRAPQIVADDVLAATFHGGDGLADPNGVVAGYINAGRRLGVRAYNDAPVTGIEVQDGRVVAVNTPLGRVACQTVVNAAGPWAGVIGEMAGVSIPIVPVRRQMVVTTPLPELDPEFPFVIDFDRSLYFHRKGDGLLTGMSNPHQPVGFDESIDDDWELTHLEAAVGRLPLLANAGLQSHWAGLYEVTPDAHPIIGHVPALEGFIVVAGFSGHGFMHGPVAGLLVSEMILDGQAHTLDISELAYERFAAGRLVHEYNVI